MAPFASGSAQYGTIIICPCSVGVLGCIAAGTSNDLTTRAADVALKERRRFILVPRETPYSLIHLSDMKNRDRSRGYHLPRQPLFLQPTGQL